MATLIAIRVICDHVRAVAFSIADGQLPSNTGAGYVIRRILRRAVRYGFTFLDKKEPFIYRLVDVLSKKMGDAFPELKSQKIAANMKISPKTLEGNKNNLLNKLNVKNRVGLVTYAIKNKIYTH